MNWSRGYHMQAKNISPPNLSYFPRQLATSSCNLSYWVRPMLRHSSFVLVCLSLRMAYNQYHAHSHCAHSYLFQTLHSKPNNYRTESERKRLSTKVYRDKYTLFISTRAIGYIVTCSVFQLEFKSPGIYIGFNVTNKNGIFKKIYAMY